MIKKRLIACCFIFLMSIIFTGCSNSLKDENITLSKEVNVNKEKNMALEKTINDLNNRLREQELKDSTKEEPTFKDKSNFYPIYSANINTYKKQIDAYIFIPKEIELKQKLNSLAKILTEVYFDNLPIQIVNFEDINKKKIVVVNLNETLENQGILDSSKLKGYTWYKYFQGSTGGTITSTRLIETILQRDYSGQWIDGVKFLYNNKVCNFDHTPDLSNVNYRK